MTDPHYWAGVNPHRTPEEFHMPTINIPAKVRFALYVVAALAVPLTAYLFESKIIGKEEVTLIGAYIALVNALAATKTNAGAQ